MEEKIKTRTLPKKETSLSPEDRLLEYVESQIERMKRYTDLGNSDGIPGFYELNQALMEFTTIQSSLISMGVMAKMEYDKATEAFKDWYSEKYVETRERLNPPSLAGSKWASQTEIDAYIRMENRTEYNKLHREMSCAEMKVDAMRRIQDSWNTYSLILNRLCKNVETEMANTATNYRHCLYGKRNYFWGRP